MKYPIIFILILCAVTVQAQQEPKKQTLKDLLYSGKLKKDSSGVIRSTDDLSSKIDTSTKKPVDAEKPKPVATTTEPTKQVSTTQTDPKPSGITTPNEPVTTVTTTTAAVTETAVAPKSNTKLWKEYTDSLTTYLKSELLNSKQIKKATYFMIFDYEIDVDGKVAIVNVTSTPENSFLQAQVKQFLDSTPFQLNPVLDSAGQPRKVKRKQSFNVTKD